MLKRGGREGRSLLSWKSVLDIFESMKGIYCSGRNMLDISFTILVSGHYRILVICVYFDSLSLFTVRPIHVKI